MPFPPLKSLALIAGCTALAACAGGSSRYPSLEIRPGERVTGTFEPEVPDAAPAPPPVASPELIARVSQLQAEASTAHADFLDTVPAARREAIAARGAPVASDAWASAQIALADLESIRSLAAIPLGELDVLYVDATLAGDLRAEIDTARDAVIALLTEEDAILAELRAAVR